MNNQAKPEKRQKIEPVSILLVGELQAQTAINKISCLPLDDQNPIEILFREKPKKRGLDQNGYYHLRVGEIAKQAWFKRRQFSHDTWHEYAKKEIMPEFITNKKGERVSKWIDMPDGGVRPISTTELERKCFAEYTTAVEAFGASLGVHFSDRPR